MSTLAELQRSLQQYVLNGDVAVLDAVNSSATVSAQMRLDVYFGAYRLRLVEALASNMPRLQQFLGEREFATLAQHYLEAHPSKFASIRWFGDRLADALAQTRPAEPWLSELVRWEWTLASAFDAADAVPITVEALAAIAPQDWPGLQLDFHPSVQLLYLRTNAPLLFRALAAGQPPPEPAVLAQALPWLIWRRDLVTQYHSLEPAQAAALATMRAGGAFAMLCETLCDWYASEAVPLQAAATLKQWVADGLVSAVRT